MELGGVDGYVGLAIAYHALEGFHLVMGDAGKVVPAVFDYPCSVHQEVVDELGSAGYAVAVGIGTADEDVAGADDPVNYDAPAVAWPFVHLALDGYVRDDSLALIFALIVFLLLVEVVNELVQLLSAGFLCVGCHYCYEPVILSLVGHVASVGVGFIQRLRRRQVR